MQTEIKNRITDGLLDWTEKESRLRAVFGNGVVNGRDFLGAKRDFFSELYQNCRTDPNGEEKVMLGIVKGEIRKLDRRMYPNAAIRILAKLGESIKKWLRPDYGAENAKLTGVSHRSQASRTEYKSTPDKRNQLQESAGQKQDAYLKKRNTQKSRKRESVSSGSEKDLLPKRRRNPNNGQGIH